ncbi:MAG: class I SAM-dependent methyltransferase [Chloroflexi bacterium]|nr:MAG: class I SAM-dependent methyltransferase [Chloroflexota bacterium]
MTLYGCPLCERDESSPYYSVNGYALVQCRACGTVAVRPMPGAEQLAAHYQRAEYFAGEEGQGYADYTAMKKALRPHFQRRLRALASAFPQRGKLLDFGCAAGYFLEMARSDGWEIAGVELSTEMARTATQSLGIPVVSNLAALPPGTFQAITLWEVIEHLPRPIDVLAQLSARLSPGGALMLSTPNTAHWQAVRAKEKWVAFRPPSHLLYFTPTTLQRALSAAGFAQISIRGVMPLPELPPLLEKSTASLQRGLANGSAYPWPLALILWRAIRLAAWGWQRIRRPQDNPFATLEAIAFKPK